MRSHRRKITLLLLFITAGAACILLSSCNPYLPVNPKYSYSSFSLELGDPVPAELGEYVDLSEMSAEDAKFAKEHTQLLLDGTDIDKAGEVMPGDHTLTIIYCGHQYRQYSFTVTDNDPPVFTRADGLYTFEGIPIDENLMDTMFDATDNSGKVKIKLKKPKLDFDTAGKYKVKAIATDPSGNKATAVAVVNVQKPEYGAMGTYVFVSIDNQHLTYFVDGKPAMDCPVVTGNINGHSTPRGTYHLNYKSRNIILKGTEDNGDTYESFVNYWMAFIGSSYGLHDATWRSNFGGEIYKGGGSHGCVNMPYASAAELYGMVEPGIPVLVY